MILMEEHILKLLRRPNYRPLTPEEMLGQLRLPPNKKRELLHVLGELERGGSVARIKQGTRYALPVQADLVPGRIRMNRQGVGLLHPDDPTAPAIRIPNDATATAMHGDHVLVRRDVVPRARGRSPADEITGRVIRVLESARGQLVGTLQKSRQFFFVVPDDPRVGSPGTELEFAL